MYNNNIEHQAVTDTDIIHEFVRKISKIPLTPKQLKARKKAKRAKQSRKRNHP